MSNLDAVVIGAGPAGLAAAQQLASAGLRTLVLDKGDTIGAVWRGHYDRLHLHTPRAHSSLPGMPLPKAYGGYPSRTQFADYLEAYARRFDIKLVFGTAVDAVGVIVAPSGQLRQISLGARRVAELAGHFLSEDISRRAA